MEDQEKAETLSEKLRTGLEVTLGKLSEEGATSDRFRGKRGKAVRRWSNFRQVQRKNKKSCQKKEELRTGF